MNLKGKVAIVTGAGQGMGRGIATKLAADGAAVYVTDRHADRVEETVRLIREQGYQATGGVADVSKVADITAMFDGCEEQLGKVDILVANAGVAPIVPIAHVTEEIFENTYNVNAKGTLFSLKEAGARMNDGGHIVVISSSSVHSPVQGMIVYSSSKAAIQLMVEVAAREFAPRNITVNCVQPGLTVTPKMLGTMPVEFQQMMIENTVAKRLGTPEDIAEVVAFYCSDESHWVTGQTILAVGSYFG